MLQVDIPHHDLVLLAQLGGYYNPPCMTRSAAHTIPCGRILLCERDEVRKGLYRNVLTAVLLVSPQQPAHTGRRGAQPADRYTQKRRKRHEKEMFGFNTNFIQRKCEKILPYAKSNYVSQGEAGQSRAPSSGLPRLPPVTVHSVSVMHMAKINRVRMYNALE